MIEYTDRGLRKLREAIAGLAALGRAGRRGALAGQRLGLCYNLTAIKNNLAAIYRYTLPKFTIRDHLKDCFGWLCEAQT